MPAAFARIVVAPRATPVTGTCTWVCPNGMNTVAGTVAIAVASELRFTVSPPAAAGADNVSAMLSVWPTVTCSGFGAVAKESESATVTARVSGAKPDAAAVTVVVPSATPVIWGLFGGTNAPLGMITGDVTVAMAVLAIVRFTTTSPTAGVERLIGRLADCPGPTTGTTPMLMSCADTVMDALAGANPGAVALMDVVPTAMPLIVNVAVVSPSLKVSEVGATVARPLLPEASVTVTPPLGAGAASVTVPPILRPTPTTGLAGATVIVRSATVTVAVASVKPLALAVIWTLPVVVAVVTVTVAAVAPSSTVTEAGTVAIVVLPLTRFTS